MHLIRNLSISFNLLAVVFGIFNSQDFDFTRNDGKILKITSDLPARNSKQLIPKIFHTIWIDFGKGLDIFPKYINNMQRLQEMHKEWKFKLWREYEIVDLIKKHYPYFLKTFLSYDVPIKKHDAARIVILHKFGGVYIDHDSVPLKSLNPLMKSYKFVVGNEEETKVIHPLNGLMGSVPNFTLLKKYIKYMNNPKTAKKHVLIATGPNALKECMIQHAKRRGMKGIKLYSRKFFYPVYWNDKKTGKGETIEQIKTRFPESYLLQEYDATWVSQ